MKTKEEFKELYLNDKEFADSILAKVSDKKQEGSENLFAAIAEIAVEQGYDVTEDDVKEISAERGDELSDELIKKVSGGANCGPGIGDGYSPPPGKEDTYTQTSSGRCGH